MEPGDLRPGDSLGRFIVEGVLGRGGIGVVYKVRDPKSRMAYAAKVLNSAAALERDFVSRFKTEARTARRLSHMNVVHVFKLRRWQGTYFYVMELLEAPPLDEVMAARPLSFGESMAVLRDVAAALAHIHSKRFVHRDIKPGNVLIRPDGLLKVIDFGLAQRAGRVRRTRSGHVLGTAKYMAPELIRGADARHETDIYALGVMAYELIAGRPPFEADHGDVIMDMHLYMRHKPLLDAVKGTDRYLSLMVDRMLAKSMTRRASSARTINAWFDFYLKKGWFADLPRSL